MPPSSGSTEEQRAEWAKTKKRATGNVIGCIVGIVLLAIPLLGLKYLAYLTSYRVPGARFVIPFVNIDHETSSLAVATTFAVLFGGAIAGAISSKWRLIWPVALVVFFGIAGAPAYFWYRGFVIVAVDAQGQAELRYMWPRPPVRVEVSRIGSVEAIETETPTDENASVPYKWYAAVEIDGKIYESVLTDSNNSVFEAKHRLLREKFTALLRAEDSAGRGAGALAAGLATELGDANYALKDFTEARDAYERAVKIHETTSGLSSLPVSVAALRLGRANYELKDYARAETLFKRVIAIHKELKVDSSDIDNVNAWRWYRNLLEETDRADEARNIVLPPTTLLTGYEARYGKEAARKKIEAMMEERRRRREQK